jgi:hypothetical protein
MQKRKRLIVAAAAGIAITVSVFQGPLEAQGRGKPAPSNVEKPKREPLRSSLQGRATAKKFEEPAFARGYEAGKARGLADAKDGERYDPVTSREYRDGDRGYTASYGSRDAYKSNYRAGFRQGYEDGYRNPD